MTLEFLLNQIPQLMESYGYDQYHIDWWTIGVAANTTVTVEGKAGFNYYCWENASTAPSIRVESQNGITDLTDEYVDSVWMHEGTISLINSNVSSRQFLKFIQVYVL